MASARREVAALLTASTREHDWSEPEPTAVAIARRVPPDRVVTAASYHRVIGCVVSSLRDADIPPALSSALAAAARRSTGQAMLSAAALRAVRDAFAGDLPWLAIKGPVLDEALYPRPGLRTYRDLDLLVEPRRLADAVTRLEGAGFRLVDRNWRQIRRRMVSQLHLDRAGAAPIDLHWTLLFDDERRGRFRYALDDMRARARTVELRSGTVQTFDAVDTVIHLALHAAGEGGDRLVWLKDVDMASRAAPDWDEVVARSAAAGMALPVATVLARSRRVLGAPVPVDVVRRLAPRSWRVLTAASDIWFPAPGARGVGSPATLLARSARGRVSTSLSTASFGLLRRSWVSIAERQASRVDRRLDPAHEGSLLHSAGDRADREAYFARLAAM